MNAEKILNEFIEKDAEASRMGSGDDQYYVNQRYDYVNKQKPFWIDYTKFVIKKIRKKLKEEK